MSRHDGDVDRRLRDWGQWVTSGQRGDGYPATSVLHESWSPPDPGVTPTPKVELGSQAGLWTTHRAVAALPKHLRNTVVLHYCRQLQVRDQARLLKCSVSTVYARLITARFKVKLAFG